MSRGFSRVDTPLVILMQIYSKPDTTLHKETEQSNL